MTLKKMLACLAAISMLGTVAMMTGCGSKDDSSSSSSSSESSKEASSDAADADRNGIGDELRSIRRPHDRKRQPPCNFPDGKKPQHKGNGHHNGQFIERKQETFSS